MHAQWAAVHATAHATVHCGHYIVALWHSTVHVLMHYAEHIEAHDGELPTEDPPFVRRKWRSKQYRTRARFRLGAVFSTVCIGGEDGCQHQLPCGRAEAEPSEERVTSRGRAMGGRSGTDDGRHGMLGLAPERWCGRRRHAYATRSAAQLRHKGPSVVESR